MTKTRGQIQDCAMAKFSDLGHCTVKTDCDIYVEDGCCTFKECQFKEHLIWKEDDEKQQGN